MVAPPVYYRWRHKSYPFYCVKINTFANIRKLLNIFFFIEPQLANIGILLKMKSLYDTEPCERGIDGGGRPGAEI